MKVVKPCIYCGQDVMDYWGMGDDLGWVLASGEGGVDDHCEKAGVMGHHAVAS